MFHRPRGKLKCHCSLQSTYEHLNHPWLGLWCFKSFVFSFRSYRPKYPRGPTPTKIAYLIFDFCKWFLVQKWIICVGKLYVLKFTVILQEILDHSAWFLISSEGAYEISKGVIPLEISLSHEGFLWEAIKVRHSTASWAKFSRNKPIQISNKHL